MAERGPRRGDILQTIQSYAQTEQKGRKRSLPMRFDAIEHAIVDYTLTPNFRSVYTEASKYLSIPYTEEELAIMLNRFAGKIFQDISEEYLSTLDYDVQIGEQKKEIVRLGSAHTLEIYKRLYPGRSTINAAFGLDSLEGISVPDGMIVNVTQPQVLAIAEYSLSNNVKYYQDKFHYHDVNRRNNRSVLGESSMLFVTTRPEEGILGPDFSFENSSFVFLPFTRSEFNDQIRDLVSNFRFSVDQPSLAEYQDRAREQNLTVCRRILAGQTDEMDFKYLVRVADARARNAKFLSH